MALMEEFQREILCWPKTTQTLFSHLPKKPPKKTGLLESILWTDETKVELFGRFNDVKLTQHLLTVKHSSHSCHYLRYHEFWYLLENPEGECSAISSCPEDQTHSDYAPGQWSETQQQFHLLRISLSNDKICLMIWQISNKKLKIRGKYFFTALNIMSC